MLLNRTPQLWIKINIRSRTIVLDSSALNRFFFIRLIIQWVGETALVISLGVDSSISCYLCHLLHHHPEHELNTCCGQHQGQVRITLSVTKQHSPCFRFPVLNCYFRKLLLTAGEVKWMMNINTAKYHFDTLVELRWMIGHSLSSLYLFVIVVISF